MGTHMMRLHLLLALLAYLASTVAAAAAAAAAELQLPVFRLVELQAPDEGVLTRLRAAVYDVGMFAVTGAEETTSQPPAAAAALGSLVRCAHAPDTRHGLDAALRQVQLPDGSRRRTMATETNGSKPQPIPQEAGSRCPGFERDAARLRRSVDRTGRAYAAALDVIVHGQQHPSADVDSFEVAVRDGESLEHFHMFERPLDSRSEESGPQAPDQLPTAALEMHSDIGLFIIMTAAQYFQQTTSPGSDDNTWQHLAAQQPRPQPGLFLQLPSGQVVRPLFPDTALLVMNGEGASKWMRVRAGAAAPQAAAHEVILPEDMQGMVRSWYGRMYFPLRDARLQLDPSDPLESIDEDEPITFHQYRTQTMAAFVDGQPQRASTAACSPGRKMLQDSGACPAGQLFCWMKCMTIPTNITCSNDSMQCSNSKGQIWPTEFPNGVKSHCMDCKLNCPAGPAASPQPLLSPPSPRTTPLPTYPPLSTYPPLPTSPPSSTYPPRSTYPPLPTYPPRPSYPPPRV